MDLHFGSDLRGRDDEKLGELRGVVFDPGTGQVVSLIAQHAGLDERNVVAPIGAVASADHDGVNLELSRDQFDGLPDFADAHNIAPPPSADNLEGAGEIAPDNVPDVPAVGAATGVESIAFTPVIQETEHIPRGDDVIDGHTTVRATDGDVGAVADVRVDDQTNRITGFAVEEGLIFKHEVEIPMDVVTEITSDAISLSIDKAAVGNQQGG